MAGWLSTTNCADPAPDGTYRFEGWGDKRLAGGETGCLSGYGRLVVDNQLCGPGP